MLRVIKAAPFIIIGFLMIVSSRTEAAEYGVMLILGTLAYLYVVDKFKLWNQGE